MYVVINPDLEVLLTDDEDAAEALSKENGCVMEMPGEYSEEHMEILNDIFQMIVNETVIILDNNRQAIELGNISSMTPKKDMN